MDSSLQSESPNNSDVRPSFRKPPNDTANRKYRRRSPISGSDSSSSGGSAKRDWSSRPHYSKEDSVKMIDDRQKRKEDRRDSGYRRSGKDSDSYRQSHRSSRDYHRHDDYTRYRSHGADEERDHHRSSRSGRESRSKVRSDHTRQESDHDRSREMWRKEKYSRDRSDDRGHRNKDKERETAVLEGHGYDDIDLSSNRKLSESRQVNSSMDEVKTGEWKRNRDRGGGQDDRRHNQLSIGENKNDNEATREGRGSSSVGRLKETHRSSNDDLNGPREDMMEKRKHDERGLDGRVSSSYCESDVKNEQYHDKAIRVNEEDSTAKKLKSFHSNNAADCAVDGQLKSNLFTAAGKPSASSEQVQENITKSSSGPSASSANEVDASNHLNVAKVAAMKAAELVNRNLVGSGYSSIEQKKKLLWGNKKNTAAEESGNNWSGRPLFSDRERQEKFNKLMGVKGDMKLENEATDKDGSSLLHSEKQEQLQLELEKQYTAGLRRRDGRTVGLGL